MKLCEPEPEPGARRRGEAEVLGDLQEHRHALAFDPDRWVLADLADAAQGEVAVLGKDALRRRTRAYDVASIQRGRADAVE